MHNKLIVPSSFEFLQKNNLKNLQKYVFKEIEQFSIDFPSDWPYDLNETDICFMQESNR
jgi:hypothetical protein